MKKNRIIFILIALGFLVYFISLSNGFVWDDEEQVLNNTAVHSLSNVLNLFTGSTFHTGGAGTLAGLYYKPMMSFFFTFIYSLFGPNAFFFHLVQLVIHITNSILLFFVFCNIFKSSFNSNINLNEWLAFGLSLIFLVHPINTEAVVYISALQDVLFFFFGISALLVIIRHDTIQNNTFLQKLRLSPEIITAFLSLLSLLSKETGFLFIPIIFIFLYFFKKEKLRDYLIPQGLSLLSYFFLRFIVAEVYLSSGGVSPIMRITLLERLQNIPQIILSYLKTFFFPKDLAIAQHWLIDSITIKTFYFPLLIVVLFFGGIIYICSVIFRKNKEQFLKFLFFFIWFILGLGLHLQIFPLDMTVAERWFYLPIIGLLGMIGILIQECLNYPKLKNKKNLIDLFKFACLILIILLSYRTLLRTFDWKDGLTLFSHDVHISKDAFDLENNLGVELFRVGQIDEAKVHFERSVEIAPYWWTNWSNLGAVYENKSDLEKAEEYYKKAIDNSDYYLAFVNYTGVLIKQNKHEEAKEFLEKEALLKFPYNPALQEMYRYLVENEQGGS